MKQESILERGKKKISLGRYSLAKLKGNKEAFLFRGRVKDILERNFFSCRIYDTWDQIDQIDFSHNFSYDKISYSSKEIFYYVIKSLLVDMMYKKIFYNLDLDSKLFKLKFDINNLEFVFKNLKHLDDTNFIKSLFLRLKKRI